MTKLGYGSIIKDCKGNSSKIDNYGEGIKNASKKLKKFFKRVTSKKRRKLMKDENKELNVL